MAPSFETTYCHDYAHWENDEPEINLDLEIERLGAATRNLSPYMIFAKSAGSILASKAIAEGVLHPAACLFVGFPLAMVEKYNLPLKNWLQKADCSTTLLQHEADPLGSYQDIKKYLATTKLENFSIHELPGNTHDYLEFQKIKDTLEEIHPRT